MSQDAAAAHDPFSHFPLHCLPCWESDPLRENENDRLRLFDVYLKDLRKRELSFRIIQGTGEQRLNNAINSIEDYRASTLT